jgi:hypothetical protein
MVSGTAKEAGESSVVCDPDGCESEPRALVLQTRLCGGAKARLAMSFGGPKKAELRAAPHETKLKVANSSCICISRVVLAAVHGDSRPWEAA